MSHKKTKSKPKIAKKPTNAINDEEYIQPEETNSFDEMVADLETQLDIPLVTKKTTSKRKTPSLNFKDFEDLEAQESTPKRPRTDPAPRPNASALKLMKNWSAAEGALCKVLAQGAPPLGRNYSGLSSDIFFFFGISALIS